MPQKDKYELSYDELLVRNKQLLDQINNLELELKCKKGKESDLGIYDKSLLDDAELFKLIFNNAADGILVGNTKGEIINFNQSFLNLTGYDKDYLLNKHIKYLFHDAELENKPLDFSKLNRGSSIVSERYVTRFGGEPILVEMNSRMLGETGYVTIIRDLAEREKAQQAIQESRERYKILSELSLEGLIIHDNGIIVEVNKAMTSIFGYSRNELIGADIVKKIAVEKYWSLLKNKTQNHTSEAYEIEVTRKNSECFFVEIEGRDITYENKQLRVVTIRDISFRKKLENLYLTSLKLHGLTEKYDFKEIIEWLLKKLLLMFDSEAGFIYLPNCEHKKMNVSYWCNSDGIFLEDELSCMDNKPYNFKEASCINNKIYDGDEEIFDIPDIIGVNVFNQMLLPVIENGNVKMLVGVFNRRSGYTQLDKKIFSTIIETLWVVLERYGLQSSLRTANASKDKFLSIIAHDLRSPLSSISSMLKLISNTHGEYDYKTLHEYLNVLSDTSESTLALLNNLLQWARTQTNSLELYYEQLNVTSILQPELEVLLQAIENKELKIINNIADDIMLCADKNTLKTIFRNLISNSIKFTPRKGSIEISISKYDDKYAVISIKDTGIGICSEEIDKIFDISSGYNKLGTEYEKGSGLGLVLCMEFVKLNKGKLWVESEQGKGSSFYFTIPFFL